MFRNLECTEFFLYEPFDCKVSNWFLEQENVIGIETPIPSEGRLKKFISGGKYWTKELAKQSFSFFEAMNLPIVQPKSGASVLTIHDLRGLTDKNVMRRQFFSFVLKRALKKADHVFAVSTAVKKEILEFYAHNSIYVAYNGIDIKKFQKVDKSKNLDLRKKFHLPSNFLLAVGHFEKRKNYGNLIDAVSILKSRGSSCPLVIIGNDSGQGSALEKKISELNLKKEVRILTGLSDQEVLWSYQCSSLFVFPSLYEGFGIPILEAMASGKPMVLSNLPVFKEITEERALYFDPNSAESMANAIEIGLLNSTLRKQMVDYGSKRVKGFDFQTVGKSLAAIYKSLA